MKKSSYFLILQDAQRKPQLLKFLFPPSYFIPYKYPAQCSFYFWYYEGSLLIVFNTSVGKSSISDKTQDFVRKTYLLLFVIEVRTGKSPHPQFLPVFAHINSYLPAIAAEIENPWVLAASPVCRQYLLWCDLLWSYVWSFQYTGIFTAASAVLYKHYTNPPNLTVMILQSRDFSLQRSLNTPLPIAKK